MTETLTETGAEEKVPQMDVSIEKLSDIERKVDVAIPWDEVSGRLDEAYKELGKGVTVKGFRRGKVPRKMLERLFGKHVHKEVGQRLVQESIGKALTDNDISPVSEPKVEDDGIAADSEFRYTATLQVVPDIEAKDYFGVAVSQRPAKATDEDVIGALEQKRLEGTEYLPVEGRETQAGDVVTVDVIGKVGDQPVDFEGRSIELGDTPKEPLPGLAAKLTGIAADTEELDVEIDVPVHAHDADGKHVDKSEKARLLVTVTDIKQKVVPELDDDFAKDTGEAENLEGLKEVLRKELLAGDEKRAVDEAKTAMVDKLVELNDVPVIPALVERHLDQVINLQMALFGMDPRSADIDKDMLKDQARSDSEKAVKSMLLLDAIGKQEKVEVQDADLEKKFAELAAARDQNVARVRSEYEKEGRVEGLRKSLREEKTLELLFEKATITIEEPAKKDEEKQQEASNETEDATGADDASAE